MKPPRSEPLTALELRLKEKLLHALDSGDAGARAGAAAGLRHHGASAVEPLCRALDDPHPEVRARAAEVLGEIGDERAVGPLTKVLERCFLGRSAHRQLIVGRALMGCGFLLMLWCFHLADRLPLPAALVALLPFAGFACATHLYKKRRRAERLVGGAVVAALGRLAEQSAAPQLRASLPLLKVISADAYHQDEPVMKAAGETAARIEALTGDLKTLPLSASSPAPAADGLPRPAAPPEPDTAALPRASGHV